MMTYSKQNDPQYQQDDYGIEWNKQSNTDEIQALHHTKRRIERTDTKDCRDCVYHSIKTTTLINNEGLKSLMCDYPVPAYLKIKLSGGNFLSGYEATDCQLFKNKVMVATEVIGELK